MSAGEDGVSGSASAVSLARAVTCNAVIGSHRKPHGQCNTLRLAGIADMPECILIPPHERAGYESAMLMLPDQSPP